MNEAESDTLRASIERIREERGCGVLVVEHDLRLIMQLCETIHVLNEGELIARGAPDEVRSDPAVVAAYIGQAEEVEERSWRNATLGESHGRSRHPRAGRGRGGGVPPGQRALEGQARDRLREQPERLPGRPRPPDLRRGEARRGADQRQGGHRREDQDPAQAEGHEDGPGDVRSGRERVRGGQERQDPAPAVQHRLPGGDGAGRRPEEPAHRLALQRRPHGPEALSGLLAGRRGGERADGPARRLREEQGLQARLGARLAAAAVRAPDGEVLP